MTELVFNRPTTNLTSGFVGTIGCWFFGISLAVTTVLASVSGGFVTRTCGLCSLLLAGTLCGWARTASPIWKLRLTAGLICAGLLVVVAEILLRSLTQFPIQPPPRFVAHTNLGYILNSDHKDVDANGFRNLEIPEQADIVCIGDGQTQGQSVDLSQTWPQQLGSLTNQTVYNMGVDGYGPLQYENLVTKALQLRPNQIVIALNLTTDLGDASAGIRIRESGNEIGNSFRHAIGRHTAVGSAAMQFIKQLWLFRPSGFDIDHSLNPTFISANDISNLSGNLDLTDPEIAAAFRKTTDILHAASQLCQSKNVRMTVLLIPSREYVYFNSQKNPRNAARSIAAGCKARRRGTKTDVCLLHQTSN